MKKLLCISIVIAIACLFTGCGENSEATDRIFDVTEVSDDPLSFTGSITVNGVVAESDGAAVFTIQQKNKSACCPAVIIRAEYNGGNTLPKTLNEVNITGTFAEDEYGVVFQVDDFVIVGG